jgi:Pyruvate/2-oxoacid:ferredoxin oxidoreductase delta subunit
MYPEFFWMPVVGLLALLLVLRKWEAAPLVAVALLLLGFYMAMHYGEWSITIGNTAYGAGFWYAILYTIAVAVMGARFIRIYRGKDRYMIVRTVFNMFAQLGIGFALAFWLPYEWGGGAPDAPGSGVFFMYVWPLEVNSLLIGKFEGYHTLVKYFLAYNIIAALIVMPVLVYFYGKRVYCSWLCGCGCLAETFGDPFRRLTPRSRWSRAVEPAIHFFVLAAVVLTTYVLLTPREQLEATASARSWYSTIVKFGFSSLIGVGFYSLFGARLWCRYICPWAGLFGLLARFGRYAIRTRGDLCIGCGMCNTYCEMGIDIRGFAMRGEPVKTTTCVGCGMCIEKCPRRVLSFAME